MSGNRPPKHANQFGAWLYRLGVLSILIAAIAQGVVTFQSYAVPWAKKIVPLIGEQGWQD